MGSNGVIYKSLAVPSRMDAVEKVCHELLDQARAESFDTEETFGIHLALEEAFLNAVKHGNKMDQNKQVRIECLITPEKFDISIADEGEGFDPEAIPDPRSGENLYKANGRGVLLMHSYMDIVEYNDMGNCVHMVKYTLKGSKFPRVKS